MKKILLILIGVMLFSSIIFAKTITIVINGQIPTQKWAKYVKKGFEKKYPNIKLNILTIGGTNSTYDTKVSLLLRTNNTVDIAFVDSFLLKDYYAANLLSPIKFNKFKDYKEFYKAFRNSTKINGKYYGIPFETDTRGLLYNKMILKKAGVKIPWHPKNWAQILRAVKKIKKNVSGVIPFYATTVANTEETSMQTFEMLLYGTNNKLMKNGKWVVQSQGFYNSLEFLNEIFRNHMGPRPGIIVNPNSSLVMAQQLAPENKVGIILNGTWNIGYWKNFSPGTMSKYGLTAMPTEYGQGAHYITMSGGWAFVVNRKSTNKKLAIKLLKFITNKNNLLEYSKLSGNITTRKDVKDSSKYPKILKKATELLKYAKFRPRNDKYPLVSIQIQNAVESIALGQQTPNQAMKLYATQVTRIVGKSNVIKLKYKKA